LETLKQPQLAEITRARSYILGNEGLRSYEICKNPTGSNKVTPTLACGVLAKELALQRVKVHYTLLPLLILGSKRADEFDFFDKCDYVVVGDVGDNYADYAPADWSLAQAILLTHINRGGGVILGNTFNERMPNFSLDMVEAMDAFTTIILR
jgi:hypothetical protein